MLGEGRSLIRALSFHTSTTSLRFLYGCGVLWIQPHIGLGYSERVLIRDLDDTASLFAIPLLPGMLWGLLHQTSMRVCIQSRGSLLNPSDLITTWRSGLAQWTSTIQARIAANQFLRRLPSIHSLTPDCLVEVPSGRLHYRLNPRSHSAIELQSLISTSTSATSRAAGVRSCRLASISGNHIPPQVSPPVLF